MTISSYTATFNLGLVDFNTPLWGDDINANWRIVDAALAAADVDFIFAVAAGTNDLSAVYSPVFTSYTVGMKVSFKAVNSNTGDMTLNVDGLGVKPLLFKNGQVAVGDIDAGDIITVVYDGTSFNIVGNIRQDFTSLSIFNNSSGATANSLYDDVVIENNIETGISFLVPNDERSTIAFGDPDDNDIGLVQYDHATDTLFLQADASSITIGEDISFDASGAGYAFQFGSGQLSIAESLTDNVVRLGSSLSTTNGLFISLTNGRVGINTSTPSVALEVVGIIKATSFQGGLDVSGLTGILPVSAGGTGGGTAATARDGLELGAVALEDAVDNTNWDAAGSKLAVPNGGSGVGTLTGYLVGNGTSPFSAVDEIPYADISGAPDVSALDAAVITTGTFGIARLGAVFDDASLPAGAYTLPGGLIIQWGRFLLPATPASGTQLVNYPIAFPNQAFEVLISPKGDLDDNDDGNEPVWAFTTASLTQFTCGFDSDDKNATNFAFIALGN